MQVETQELWATWWWFPTFFIFTIFHPYLGKWSNFTNIFEMGWNHQLGNHLHPRKIAVTNPTKITSPAVAVATLLDGFVGEKSKLPLEYAVKHSGIVSNLRTLKVWHLQIHPKDRRSRSDSLASKIGGLGGGFKFFGIFTPIWGRFPIWLIFFTWVETTNQWKFWNMFFFGGGTYRPSKRLEDLIMPTGLFFW